METKSVFIAGEPQKYPMLIRLGQIAGPPPKLD